MNLSPVDVATIEVWHPPMLTVEQISELTDDRSIIEILSPPSVTKVPIIELAIDQVRVIKVPKLPKLPSWKAPIRQKRYKYLKTKWIFGKTL